MTEPDAQGETLVARIAADRPTAQRIADLLSEELDPDNCAISIFEQDSGWVAEAVFRRPEDGPRIEDLIRQVVGPDAAVSISSIAERDWVASSLEGLAPVMAGRFVIHGAHDRGAVKPNKIGIEIEAALAFGTGHHGTTAGCLEMIEAVCTREKPRNALDLGTGSAVLAIAIARLRHIPVLATDIDPVATKVAAENVRLNQASAYVAAATAVGFHHPVFAAAGPFDLIVANILARPLMKLAPAMARSIVPGGSLILSGILASQRRAVIAAYAGQRFRHVKTLWREGWVTIHLKF